MSYRIRYEVRRGRRWQWGMVGLCLGFLVWCGISLAPVWKNMTAGDGLYDALARFVGEMILGAR